MRIFITFLCIASYLLVQAQTSQAEYLEAKRQFALGNYETAKQSFSSLTNDANFGAYASFYYALSALKLGKDKEAYDMWRQIQLTYPEWEQKKEVNFWLGYVSFKQAKYYEAFRHIEALPTDLRESLIRSQLSGLSLEQLNAAYALNPSNEYIGSYLARAIQQQPYEQRDQVLLGELSDKFEISIAQEEIVLPKIRKSQYAIAAVLPFMFDSLGNPQTVIRNSIIFDLYQGMKQGQRDLLSEGIFLELFPYDTKKQASEARKLVASRKLEDADVIIGPLYGGPSEVITAYSKEKKINMINPLSSNSEVIGSNPYSFLFKPSYETQGRIAGAYASRKFSKNKKAFIFYETDRDSLVANAYREVIQQDSFFVIRFERITNESAQQVQKDFIEQYEARLDTLYDRNQLDSIGLIPGRFVKTRPLRDEKTGRILRDRNGEDLLEYYENRFKVVEDSIGHIFAATSSNLLANNFISLAEVRSDTIGIIGYEDWLDFSLVAFDQLERLGISMISPSYYDTESDTYQELKEDFIYHVGREPGEYHVIGYELMMQLGRLLKEHGTYFQRGLNGGHYIPGQIMSGIKYGPYNDNQIVPMIQLKNLRLINQTSQETVKK